MANGIRKGLAFLLASAVVVGAFDAGALADGKHNHRDEDRKPQGNVQQNSENYEWYKVYVQGKLVDEGQGPKGDVGWLIAGVYSWNVYIQGNMLYWRAGNQNGKVNLSEFLPEGYTVGQFETTHTSVEGTNSQKDMYDNAIIEVTIRTIVDEDGKETALPTPEPTPVPTPEPTEEPTPEPTEEPTPEPTEEPTPEPTEEPTPEPTEEPTPEPTEEPTPEPTEEPTPEPTEEPTQEPTEEPTPEPTEEPTPEPTEEPTPEPTEEPTPEPTEEPTEEPEDEESDIMVIGDELLIDIFDENVPLANVPKTGDPASVWTLMGLASAGGLFLLNRRRRK